VGQVDAHARPLYFVSYAHDFGEDDGYVRRFHADLMHDVRLYTGLRGDDLGFCDAALRAGDLWSPALVDALRTCQVFLALCSPTYFSRPSCGKEWTIFTRRLAAAPARRVGSTSSLIPLFWVPTTMPDDVAGPYQYRDHEFGAAYHDQGLRDLIRLADNDGHYKRFVAALARRVRDLVRAASVPAYGPRPAFDAVAASFPAGPGATRVDPAPATRRAAPRSRGWTADPDPDRERSTPRQPTRPVLNPRGVPPIRAGGGRAEEEDNGPGVPEGDR
jgi:hypothetical protein